MFSRQLFFFISNPITLTLSEIKHCSLRQSIDRLHRTVVINNIVYLFDTYYLFLIFLSVFMAQNETVIKCALKSVLI